MSIRDILLGYQRPSRMFIWNTDIIQPIQDVRLEYNIYLRCQSGLSNPSEISIWDMEIYSGYDMETYLGYEHPHMDVPDGIRKEHPRWV